MLTWRGAQAFLNHSAKKVQTRTELSLLKLCRAQPFLNHDAKIRQFPDTTKFQRVIRRDFQHAFNPKPVKQSNSPFCAPQLILFQKRKHRVEHLNTLSTTNNKIQKAIRNLPQFLSSSVPQFFSDPSLLS